MTGAVPVDPEPAQRLLDLVDRLGDLAARVGVLDPQAALAALLAREQPVEEERANAADVEEAGRARSHADADGHRAYRRRRMEFGAHMSSSGGIDTAIDRIEAIGGDCVQVFTQSPRMWRPTNHKPEAIERFKARRARGRRSAASSATRSTSCNLAAPDDVIYEKSIATMRATVDAACAIEADAVIFHVGSHLGAGFEAGLDRTSPRRSEQVLERCDGDTWLLMENSAGAGRHDRALARGARDAGRARSTATRGSASASTRATSTPRATTSPTRRRSTSSCARSTR